MFAFPKQIFYRKQSLGTLDAYSRHIYLLEFLKKNLLENTTVVVYKLISVILCYVVMLSYIERGATHVKRERRRKHVGHR